jgi:asparagine synthase (glutamine-hydrolysing)
VPREVDPRSLQLYLDHQFVPAPHTMIAGVEKVRPGELVIVGRSGELTRELYCRWQFGPKLELGEEEASERLGELLRRAVRRQMMSDVPLGAFLSGGIDSSSLVFMMGEEDAPVRTFTLGSTDPDYDERPAAREVARALATDHHEEVLPADVSALVAEVTERLDEPLGDASAVPTYQLARAARRSVTVCLAGDGGDELLAGYERHLASMVSRRLYERLPESLRRRVLEPLAALVPSGTGRKTPARRLHRFLAGAAKDPRGGALRWQTFLSDACRERILTPALRAAVPGPRFAAVIERAEAFAAEGDLDRELAVELGLYLPDDILTKLDRMSMAASLETRVPFLDHDLVEFTLRLPERMKMRHGRGKHILRRAMRGRLPRRTLTRRKQGFGMPVADWLRGEVGEMVADSFAGRAFAGCPWVAAGSAGALLAEHRDGRGDHSHVLWSLFVFARWLERLGTPSPAGELP